MSTLMRSPLRMSLSMTSGHETPVFTPVPEPTQPLGYLYASWDPGAAGAVGIDMGYFDPDTQTWVDPNGFITAGVPTKTRTSGCPGDCVTDDACF